MDNSLIIVGSEACPLNKLEPLLRTCPILRENWTTFARVLEIPSEDIEKLRKDLLLSTRTYSDVLNQIISIWIGQNGSLAFLNTIVDILENVLRAGSVAEQLRLEFNLGCGRPLIWEEIGPLFQEKIMQNFQTLFPTLDPSLLCSLDEQILQDLMTGKAPNLIKSSPSTNPKHFMERKLLPRNILNNSLLKGMRSDVLLFTGIEQYELSQMAKNESTSSSTEQLDQVTVRFIHLDQPSHFDKIGRKTDRPVHWIHKEDDGKFRWIRSKGDMTSVQLAIDPYQVPLSTSQVLDLINNPFPKLHVMGHLNLKHSLENEGDLKKEERFVIANYPVIISSSPGMGKSVFLSKIEGTLKKSTGRTVLHTSFPHFISQVKLSSEGNLEAQFKTGLACSASTNHLGKAVILSLLNTASRTITVELLLDGMDELDDKDFRLALEILKIIKNNFRYVRFWITTRPHLLHHLENTLNGLSFSLKAFDEQDQLNFLTHYWHLSSSSQSKERLEIFAKNLLHSFKSFENNDISGIPLQLQMIAKIFKDDALDFAETGITKFVNNRSYSMPSLYQDMVELQLKNSEKQEITDMHVRLALKLLFADFENLKNVELDSDELLKVGIIEDVNLPKFIHRTFADHFISFFVAEKLQNGKDLSHDFLHFIFNNFLATSPIQVELSKDRFKLESFKFSYPVACNFLNYFLLCLPKPFKISKEFISFFPKILHSTLHSSDINLFKFIYNLITFNETGGNFINSNFLILAIQTSSLEMIKLVFSNFEIAHKLTEKLKVDLLLVAVQRGDFSILEFLLKEKGGKELLDKPLRNLDESLKAIAHMCVANSKDHNAKLVDQKLQVIQYLNEINSSLLKTKDGQGLSLLEQVGVHFRLIIKLIELSCPPTQASFKGDTFLHMSETTSHLTSDQFNAILKAIPSQTLNLFVATKGVNGDTPLSRLLRFMDPTDETLELLFESKANFNHEDSQGYSTLAIAIISGRNDKTLRKLLGFGANPSWRKWPRRKSLLHFAGEYGNVDAVKVLLELKEVQVNEKDLGWRTALEYCLRSDKIGNRFEAGQTLLSNGAIFKAKKNKKLSKLHKAILKSNVDSVNLLILLGMDVNEKDSGGNTPLHLCLERDSAIVEMTSLLLDNGAEANLRNGRGELPFEVGLKNKFLDWEVFFLLKAKTDPTWSAGLATLVLQFISCNAKVLADKQLADLVKECEEHGANFNFADNKGDSLLHCAVDSNCVRIVGHLVRNGADLNTKNNIGQVPLHKLVSGSDVVTLKIAMQMIQGGADVFVKDAEGNTFLHRYIQFGEPSPSQFHSVVEAILQINAEQIFNVQNNRGQSPLHLATLKIEMMDETLNILRSNANFNEKDNDGNSVIFYSAIGRRSIPFLNMLLNFGTDPRELNLKKQSLLHISTGFGTPEITEFLVNSNFDVNSKDFAGNTPLHSILPFNKKFKRNENVDELLQIINLLVKAEVDVSLLNNKGRTFLHNFVRAGPTPSQLFKLGDFLTKRKQNLFDSKDKKGITPFHLAVRHHILDLSLLTFLKKNGADFNSMDFEGNSILFYAIKAGLKLDLIGELIKLGSNTDHVNKQGESIFDLATKTGNISLMTYWVRNFGQSELLTAELLNFRFSCGSYLLHKLIEEEDEGLFHFLIAKGANINSKDGFGHSPLHKAACIPNKQVSLNFLKFLVESNANVLETDEEGQTFLHLFILRSECLQGHFENLAVYLLEKRLSDLFFILIGDDEDTSCYNLAIRKLNMKPDNKILVSIQKNGGTERREKKNLFLRDSRNKINSALDFGEQIRKSVTEQPEFEKFKKMFSREK